MANEPRNLYELKDYFQLVQGGQTYEIDEPADWDKVHIQLDRDKAVYGFNYEFVDPEINLLFQWKEGGDIIKGEKNLNGSDGVIEFIYGYERNSVKEPQYRGAVNLNYYQEVDEGVRCQIMKVVFDSLLRTRHDVKVSMRADKSIDGATLTPPTALRIKLHSKRIKKYGVGTKPEDWVDGGVIGAHFGSSDNVYIQPDTQNLAKAEVEEMQAMPINVDNVDPLTEDRFQFKAVEAGHATLTFQQKLRLVRNRLGVAGNVGNWRLEARIVHRRAGVVLNTYTDAGATFTGHAASYILDYTFDFNFSREVDLLINDELFFIMHLQHEGGASQYRAMLYEGKVEIMEETYAPSSLCTGYKIFDVLNHAAAVVTGRENIVRSDFFGPGGCGEKYLITNGFQVRNFADSDKPVLVSLKDWFGGANPIWNLGVQYVQDPDGSYFMRVEPARYFFGGKRLMHFDKIFEYSEVHEKEVTYNELEFGYERYAEDDLNTLDEFNTRQNWLTPIKTYKGKYTQISKFIASGYLLEKVRREQYKANPSTSLTNDDDLFIVAYTEQSVFTTQYLAGSYTGEIPGATGLITFGRIITLEPGDKFVITDPAFAADGVEFTVVQRLANTNGYAVNPAPGVEFFISTGQVATISDNFQAERDEPFAKVENLISPESAYNLRISPKRMLLNHSDQINISLYKKLSTEVLKNTFTKNNGELITLFNDAEPCKLTDTNIELKENADLALSDFNSRRAIHTPDTVTFKTEVRYDHIVWLKERLLGQTLTEDDYGTISFPDLHGGFWEGYVWSIDYEPYKEQAKFICRKTKKIG